MKRILFVIACLAIAGIQSVKAQPSIAALHHARRVTLYSGAQLQTVIDKAMSGDTIYLSEGTFGGGITINKSKIALIGAGERTVISGTVRIGNGDDAINNLFLEGLNIRGDINVSGGNVTDIVVSQCQLYSTESGGSYVGMIRVVNMVRCNLKNTLKGNFTSISLSNSKIKEVSTYHASLNHCNIGKVDSESDDVGNIYTNCIIDNFAARSHSSESDKAVLINCLVSGNTQDAIVENCKKENSSILDENLEASPSFIGNDGTVVGIMGGDTPYTLIPSAPHVSEHKIEVDAESQKLNVTLTIEN
ncbi:MAG: hypothetical protein IK144_09720 [Bacteroidaceae bacterium]|nr:hypothetical protein [Bacteroidaceae bacterium]